MNSPVLAHSDTVRAAELARDLPQSLIIEAEQGLDTAAMLEAILSDTPNERHHIRLQDNKQQISVEQIRDTLARLSTFAKQRRVVVIEPAEAMNDSAQSALLKTLEEPNQGIHFILISYATQALLPTIYSRCRLHVMQRTSREQDTELVSSLDIDAQTSQQIVFLAAGRPILLRSIAENSELLASYQRIAADAKQLLSLPSYERLVLLHPYMSNRDSALRLLDILLSMIHFQLFQRPQTNHIHELATITMSVEASLKKHANTKLALLRFTL